MAWGASARPVERREHARVDTELSVDYRRDDAGGTLCGVVRDLSEGGVFLQTEEPPELGVQLDMSFSLTEGGKTIQARAEVVYRNPQVERRSVLLCGAPVVGGGSSLGCDLSSGRILSRGLAAFISRGPPRRTGSICTSSKNQETVKLWKMP